MSGRYPLHAAPLPCNSCPDRRDTPPGVWSEHEYNKLPVYDEGYEMAVFHCHQENATGVPTVCRGWLTVHSESVAVRHAAIRGWVTVEQVYAPVAVDLYESGAEAAEAGLAGVANPSPEAIDMVARLMDRGAGRLVEDA